MEDGFFAAPIEAVGIAVVVPDAGERERVQAIQSSLSGAEMDSRFKGEFAAILVRYEPFCDAVITACTELPLVVDQSITSMTVVDPLTLQRRACTDFALA